MVALPKGMLVDRLETEGWTGVVMSSHRVHVSPLHSGQSFKRSTVVPLSALARSDHESFSDFDGDDNHNGGIPERHGMASPSMDLQGA